MSIGPEFTHKIEASNEAVIKMNQRNQTQMVKRNKGRKYICYKSGPINCKDSSLVLCFVVGKRLKIKKINYCCWLMNFFNLKNWDRSLDTSKNIEIKELKIIKIFYTTNWEVTVINTVLSV